MSEPSFKERVRVSASVIRTFLVITEHWELSQTDRLALLDADERHFDKWSNIARSYGSLALETAVLMRVSAILGVFFELQQLFASVDRERDWLISANKAAPFAGRAPLDLLRGTLEDQIAVRRYAENKRIGMVPPNEINENAHRSAAILSIGKMLPRKSRQCASTGSGRSLKSPTSADRLKHCLAMRLHRRPWPRC